MTKAKLTKTEREMLLSAARKPSGTMSGLEWYSTSSRHMKSHGGRSVGAVRSLVAKGLAENLRTHSHREANITGFGSYHTTEVAATITEAGREAVK